MRKRALWMLLGVMFLMAVSAIGFTPAAMTAQAQNNRVINAPTAVQLQTVFSGLSSPVFITHAHDGTNRLFIIEKVGRIRVAQPGASTTTVFLDITSRVLSSGNEQGLLGLAFHPQYAINGRFFVYYTRPSDGALTVAEYHVSAADPNVADTTETAFNGSFPIAHPGQTNHNGGMMAFGPDGYLYIGTGDGGSGDDPPNNSQTTTVLLGKMLRVDVDTPNGAVNYSSPPSNPFYGSTPGADEIYAYGLRNPWRWSFDRVTGQLICGDVGQGTREEIDIITNGGNYGWRIMEGLICNPDINSNCTPPTGYVPPIFDYTHAASPGGGTRCSITGGYIYRGYRSTVPVSAYVYGDYCTGEIWQLQSGTSTLLIDTSQNISSFGEDEAGELYVVGLGGTISRLAQTPAPPACTYALTATGQLFPHSGGDGELALTTATDCGWLAAANVPWITVKRSLGAGNDTLSFAVRDNFTGSPRAGLIRLGGQTFTVLQEGALGSNDCPKTLSPVSSVIASTGGTGSVTLTVNAGCAWQATPSASWITITSNSLGTGSATLTYSVAANNTGQARKGTITIGHAVFGIKQRP